MGPKLHTASGLKSRNVVPSPVLNSLTKPLQAIEMPLFEAKDRISVSAEKPAEL